MIDKILFEEIHNRLERIEAKLDDLSEWKHYLSGQAKVVAIVVSVIISVVSYFIQRLVH